MNRIFSTFAIAFLGLSLLMLGGCATTTAGGAVGADRSQLMLVSAEQLDQMAVESYAKLQSDASGKGTLNEDRAMLKRVRNIAGRLETQTKVFRADAPAWKWEVNVITSDELNAFCMPSPRSASVRRCLGLAMHQPVRPAWVTRLCWQPASVERMRAKPIVSAWNSQRVRVMTRVQESPCGRK